MHYLAVEIVRFVDDHQPGWVECEFIDAEGHSHTLLDKVPAFGSETNEDLDAASKYPQPGVARCEILEEFRDAQGREVVRITIDKPDTLESKSGLTEFVVHPSQVSSSWPKVI
jgi:hypothetical protein